MSTLDIQGRFSLQNSIYDDVLIVKTYFDAAKATKEQLRHIEGFYSSRHPRKAKVVNNSTVELHKEGLLDA